MPLQYRRLLSAAAYLFQEAENQLQQVLNRFGHDSLAGRSLFLKAVTYSERKEPATAELLLRDFLVNYRNHPWRSAAWMRSLGDVYAGMQQPGKAIDALQQALASTTDCRERSVAWFKIGNSYSAIGNDCRARAGFDSAVTIGDRCGSECIPQAFYSLGDEEYKAKEYQPALATYSGVVYKYPSLGKPHGASFK